MPGKLPGLTYRTWDALVAGHFREPDTFRHRDMMENSADYRGKYTTMVNARERVAEKRLEAKREHERKDRLYGRNAEF